MSEQHLVGLEVLLELSLGRDVANPAQSLQQEVLSCRIGHEYAQIVDGILHTLCRLYVGWDLLNGLREPLRLRLRDIIVLPADGLISDRFKCLFALAPNYKIPLLLAQGHRKLLSFDQRIIVFVSSSLRRDQEFVHVSCAAQETELFLCQLICGLGFGLRYGIG